MNLSPQSEFCFLREPAVVRRTGLSRSTIYRKAKEGTFPAPVKLGQRASGWRLSDLEAWAAALGVQQ